MSCTFDANCFTVDISPAGMSLAPQFNPSFENGLECQPGGLWDPDERALEVCEVILPAAPYGPFTNTTNVSGPILNQFTVTNPSAIHPAVAMWQWWIGEFSIRPQPGVRGVIITQAATHFPPNPLPPLIDTSYCGFQNDYDVETSAMLPGPSFSYMDCPLNIPPGGSATIRWGFRFEGAGSVGTWRAFIGDLRASALVLVTP